MVDTAAAYDALIYPTVVVPLLAPVSLYTSGQLFGWGAAHPATASILELGCSDGLNMLAVADAYPQSRCVGIDLSGEAIRRGQQLQQAAGLTNVELVHGDLTAMPPDGEKFDYIVAHGLLTWVPQSVREATFQLLRARLKPGGVAYFGYDVLPGSAPKAAILAYVRPLVEMLHDDPVARVRAFIEFTRGLSASQYDGSILIPALDLIIGAADKDPGHTLHDWLEPYYAPISLQDFAGMAAAHGLSFAGDAGVSDRFIGDLEGASLDILATAGSDPLRRATVLSLLRGVSTFRCDMLVRTDSPPPRATREQRLALHYSFEGAQAGETKRSFAGEADGDPVRKTILAYCLSRAPRELSAAEIAAGTGLSIDEVDRELFDAAAGGLAGAYATPPAYTLTPGERPRCSGLVRAMLAERDWAITSRHVRVGVANPLVRRMLTLCDGNRTRAELAEQLTREAETQVGAANVDAALAAAAERRLMVG